MQQVFENPRGGLVDNHYPAEPSPVFRPDNDNDLGTGIVLGGCRCGTWLAGLASQFLLNQVIHGIVVPRRSARSLSLWRVG